MGERERELERETAKSDRAIQVYSGTSRPGRWMDGSIDRWEAGWAKGGERERPAAST
uniref:Uncharacterized protein n=1 Tax=Oryza sativa subsp. japonica TaxID=39947 RepID=Q6K601_ORYSJ|nr:hypothetical protein [Oryza sativa Japonica Group]